MVPSLCCHALQDQPDRARYILWVQDERMKGMVMISHLRQAALHLSKKRLGALFSETEASLMLSKTATST